MDIYEFRTKMEELVTHVHLSDGEFWDKASDWFVDVLVERSRAKLPKALKETNVTRP